MLQAKATPALFYACLASSTAVAGSLEPPARYNYPHPNVSIRYAAPAEVDRLCRELMGAEARRFKNIEACARGNADWCVIIMPPDAPEVYYRHERAHCHGWPGSHPH